MSAICTFFLTMSLYPDVQLKAQQELDAVLGEGKTPTFEDRPSLPYVEAIFQEVMRWHPAIPMGMQKNLLMHWTQLRLFAKVYLMTQSKISYTMDITFPKVSSCLSNC
jgi:hypothetical protein